MMKPMNDEFGRRIRSFLERKSWWEIAKKVQTEVDENLIWQVMVAGIPQLPPEDLKFAQAMNWAISGKELDETGLNAADYESENWDYETAAMTGEPSNTALRVVGAATIRFVRDPAKNQTDTRKRGEDFAEKIVKGSARSGSCKADAPTPVVANPMPSPLSTIEWRVKGAVYLK